jgi:hypothetical protein
MEEGKKGYGGAKVALLYRYAEVGDGPAEGTTWRQGVGEWPGGAPVRRCRPAATQPRWKRAGGTCTHSWCRIGERRGMIGGPRYSPGRRGQIRFKPFKKFEVFQKLSIFFSKF